MCVGRGPAGGSRKRPRGFKRAPFKPPICCSLAHTCPQPPSAQKLGGAAPRPRLTRDGSASSTSILPGPTYSSEFCSDRTA
jgi:hypothetical protein